MRIDRTALPYLHARRYVGVALLALASVSALLSMPPASAQGSASARSLERSVKAAFLYKFLSYTEFPVAAFSDAAAPVVIGVVEADDLAAELTRMVAGRTVGTRPIAVRSMREGESAAGVHLLFLSASATGGADRIGRGPQQPLLLVTESERGLAQGSVINFRIIDQRVRFDVSLDAAEKHNVKLSSRLLTVANQVHKGGN